MNASLFFQEFSDNQRRIYDAAVQTYEAVLEARRQTRPFRGGQHWKRIKGRDYLYRYFDRYGHGQSLGPRSPHTEKLFAEFKEARAAANQRLREQRPLLTEQARLCRAAALHRVPRLAAKILVLLGQHNLGRNLLVIDTAAIHAYEFAAGVFLEGSVSQDLLASSHRRLTLGGGAAMSPDELLRVLRRADRSFGPVPGADCQAANRNGFLVEIFKPGVRQAGKQKPVTVPGALKPVPPEAGQLQYLAASPKFSQVVIGRDGFPATMAVPDPRAFALNRLWLSQQEDREEVQRNWDLTSALAVAALVLRYLPQYDFSSSELEMFPRDLGRDAEGFAEGVGLSEDGTLAE